MSAVNFTVTRASSKYVVNESGVIEEVLANTPAFEYNADGSYKGLLVESASENLCLQSEDINTTWVAVNATIATNDTTAPDETTTADKLGDDSGGGTGEVRAQQSISTTAGNTYTASVFLKADQLAYAALGAQDADGASAYTQFFGLSGDGTLGTPTAGIDNSTITAYPNGWYRCSITFAQTDADGFTFRVYVADSISNYDVDLDGTSSIFVWGAQVEEGGHASSYMPTTTTSATRAKDDISLLSASTYIGQTAGTVYLETTIDNIVPNASLISASDGSDDNIVRIGFNASGDMRMYVKASTSSIINDVETIAAGTYKFAIVYSSGDTRVYRNGVQLSSSSTSFTFGATVDEIDIGQSFAATVQADNWIKAFAFYKRAITDSEAQILTN